MWFWVISAIAGSILGNAADSWFSQTKLGIWFYKKVDDVSTWASKKLGLKVLRNESNWKKSRDNILIYNLYILIIGSIFLVISFTLSINGSSDLYNLFQKLWYPVFIPSLSLFFTAILIEAIFNIIINRKKN